MKGVALSGGYHISIWMLSTQIAPLRCQQVIMHPVRILLCVRRFAQERNLLKTVWSKNRSKVGNVHPVLTVMFGNSFQELAKILKQAIMSFGKLPQELSQSVHIQDITSDVCKNRKREKIDGLMYAF